MSKFAKYFTGISAIVLLVVGIASAQVADMGVKFSAPSSFVVRGKVLPAGDYTIRRTPTTTDSAGLLVLRGEGGSVIFDTISKSSTVAAKESKVVFEKADNRLYLSEIWVEGATVGNEVVGVKAEVTKIAKAKAAKSKGDTSGF